MSEAVGTSRVPLVGMEWTTFANPHPWGYPCHLDGEGNGPCFDARWVAKNLATETSEPAFEPTSYLDIAERMGVSVDRLFEAVVASLDRD